jgi:hypothetical protein
MSEKRNRKEINNKTSLKRGLDYYIEEGKYVFTRHYLLKRGYCCESGCRHCPYGFKASKDS